ncbi:hypothetical protein niasHT_040185 [Heterodera trifolii]|uniref:Uncharacterized protein n=1 Tax=Heterodera trifolii TaxID=157864 RepID=A0ABD2IL76_9BILA
MEEARKEAENKAQKKAEEAKEKTQKEAEEAKAQKEREEKAKKKTESEENDTIIARGIKKRRLTEAEKEERSQKDAEENARREITDIVKEVEEEAKQKQNKIEELAAKLVGKTREQMGEEEAKELEKERKRFENPPEPPRERMPFYSSIVACFECQSELDSAAKPRGREERGDRESNSGMSGKRMFTNVLKSAVGTVNDRPCIPPEGLNRDILKRRPTPAPVPQFTTRSAERSHMRKTYAPFRKGMPLQRAEEVIYKIRKSLLEAADALSELADELFPHGEAREKEEEKKEDKEAQWGGPGPSHSFM